MIEERAVILELEPSKLEVPPENSSIATLEIVRKTACGLCGQTRGCGNSIWGKLFNHKSTHFKAQNHINAAVGDSVIVGIDENALMKSALLLYIAPLATMLFGAILASSIASSESAPILGAGLGLLLGFVWVKAHTTGQTYYQKHQPKILRFDSESIHSHEKVIQF